MAKYTITSLNYIATGKGRCLVNVDYQLAGLYDYMHVLAIEDNVHSKQHPLCSDILTEHGKGDFFPTRYIEKGWTSNNDELSSHIVDEEYRSQFSDGISALSRENIPNGIVLNEQQQYWHEMDPDNRAYIRLYLSCCTFEMKKKMQELYQSTTKFEHTFELEEAQHNAATNQLDAKSGKLYALYDIDDVCLKSDNAQEANVIYNMDKSYPGKTEDLYLPQGTSIMQFCQVGAFTYLLSQSTNKSPMSIQTTLLESRKSPVFSSQYTAFLESGNLKTYNYAPLSLLSASTYEEALSVQELTSNIEMFKPKVSYDGIDYNYIMSMPMAQVGSSIGSNKTEYDNGNVYVFLNNGKNAYNALYSMQMSAQTEIDNCRQYAGLGKCGNKLYLKYYDNTTYQAVNMPGLQLSTTTSVQTKKTVSQMYPYQKIEYFLETGTKSSARHKSYFFSLDLADIDLEPENTFGSSKIDSLKSTIRLDITNAIKDIAKNVCPVQTTLLGVQFSGKW